MNTIFNLFNKSSLNKKTAFNPYRDKIDTQRVKGFQKLKEFVSDMLSKIARFFITSMHIARIFLSGVITLASLIAVGALYDAGNQSNNGIRFMAGLACLIITVIFAFLTSFALEALIDYNKYSKLPEIK